MAAMDMLRLLGLGLGAAVSAGLADGQLFPDPTPGVEHAMECVTGKIVEADPICDDAAFADGSEPLPPMPSGGRAGFAAVTIGPTLIAIGGMDMETSGSGNASSGFVRGAVQQVEALDLNTRKWSDLPSLVHARAELAAVSVGCIVVILGGFNATGGPVAAVEALDLSKDRWPWQNMDPWFELPPMPKGCRIGLAAAAVDNTVVAIGGAACDGNAVSTVEALDMVTRTWTALPDMPGGARRDLAAASVGTTIYAIGGMATVGGKDNTGLARVERLEMNLKIPKWTTLAPLPDGGRYKLAAAAVTHGLQSVVVIGGERTDLCCQVPLPWQDCWNGRPANCELATVEQYDIASETWTKRPDRSAGVGESLAAASVGGTVVALGGAAGEHVALDTVEAFCFVNPDDIPLKKDNISTWLESLTVIVSIVCVVAALFMAMNHVGDLHDLADQTLDAGEDSVNAFGLALFVGSGIDLLSDICLLITLIVIKEWLLLLCAFGVSVGGGIATLQLTYATFGKVSSEADEHSMRDWLYGGATSMACRNAVVVVAVLVSMVRFESLEILRLRLFGKAILSMPINDSHYAFIQRGNRLAVMTSLPHMLAAIAVLRDGGHAAHYGHGEQFFIILSLVCSTVSILSAGLKRVERVQSFLRKCKSGGLNNASVYEDLGGSPSGRSSIKERLTGSE